MSTFSRQLNATIKKRLVSFYHSSKEIILAVNPFIFTLVNVTIMTIVLKTFNDPSGEGPDIAKIVMEYIFPSLLILSFINCNGLYIIGPVQDRFDKTRYLLNFAG